jgi:phage terminase large subunit GpA-like protein
MTMTTAETSSQELSREARWKVDEIDWVIEQFSKLTVRVKVFSPSKWAEERRYLPSSNTALPGWYRFAITPYLREIADCMSLDSPVREVSFMKGAQIGATVGVLENAIGYLIDHVKTAPVMFVTADADMAKTRLETNVIPMIQASGLEALIVSSDAGNKRKTGRTEKKIEWKGGGYMLPFGAQNANKLRSVSIQYLLNDEIDGWPLIVGRDGDPLQLVRARTQAYEQSRKILNISTPLLKGQSRIDERFRAGDRRRYYVRCLKCGFAQVLRWRTNDAQGVVGGVVWETDKGNVVADSVRYLCQNCQHSHTNDDKTKLLDPDNGAEWRPTANAATPNHRSYHLSALYSPPGMYSWAACVDSWREAWDDERARPHDLGKLQVFYNNTLGDAFELRGDRVKFEAVSGHRRSVYKFGEIPNAWAKEHCGSAVQVLTCAVDVHKDALKVAVFGWCRGRRSILIDYWTFEGDTSQLDDPGTWVELGKLIDDKRYTADDGQKYAIAVTFVDSGFNTDQVYNFCAQWTGGVFPIKGRESPPKTAAIKEFSEFTSALGTLAYGITVDLYKDRISSALRRSWDGLSLQPEWHFNAPVDVQDKQLRELTVEVKREKLDSLGKRIGFEWHRPSGAANELFDLSVYASCALDVLAWDFCCRSHEMPAVDWFFFFDECEKQGLFLCN